MCSRQGFSLVDLGNLKALIIADDLALLALSNLAAMFGRVRAELYTPTGSRDRRGVVNASCFPPSLNVEVLSVEQRVDLDLLNKLEPEAALPML